MGHSFLQGGAECPIFLADDVRALDALPGDMARYPAAMPGLLRHEQRCCPSAVRFSAICVQDLASPFRLDAGRPVLVVSHSSIDQCGCSSQLCTAFTRRRHECRNVDEVPDPFKARNDRSTVGMTQGNRRQPASVHSLLHRCSICSERAAMQTRNMDSDSVLSQGIRQPVKMSRLVPQSVNQYNLGLLSHPHSFRLAALPDVYR